MQILKVVKSPNKQKRFRALFDNGTHLDFGIKNSYTYIDGADEDTRYNYLKRHYYNPNEKYFIDNLIISPSVLSYYLTWGSSHDINKNIKILNQYI